MKTFNSVASLKANRLKAGERVARYYYEKGDAGYAEGVVKTPAQASADGDVIDGYYNVPLANSNVWVGEDRSIAHIMQWGFVADGAKGLATGKDNSDRLVSILSNQNITNVKGCSGIYYFGGLGLDEILATITTRRVDIDWDGAYLTVNGDNSIVNTGMVFVRFNGVGGSMTNYEFEDVSFDVASSTGRGVAPVQIFNTVTSSEGYEFGNFIIHKGQSLLTCFSSAPTIGRAKDIKLTGYCVGKNVYYGVNCARNGDDLDGFYTLDTCNRAYFTYGAQDHRVRFRVGEAQPASANLLLSHSNSADAQQNTDTKNIDVKGSFGVMNGPITIADQPRDLVTGEGVYKNITIDIIIDSIGSNLQNGTTNNFPIVKIGSFDTNGSYILTETTQTLDDIKISLHPSKTINTHGKLTEPLYVYSQSPNFGLLEVNNDAQMGKGDAVFPETVGGDTFKTVTAKTNSWFFRGITGALTDGAGASLKAAYIPVKYIAPSQRNTLVQVDLQIVAAREVGPSGVFCMADYYIIGYLSSTGAINLTSAFQKSIRGTGGITPALNITAADPYSTGINDHLKIELSDNAGSSGYSKNTATLVVKVTTTS